MTRLLDGIAMLLAIAPIANAIFLWRGASRYLRDPLRSYILLALLMVLGAVWVIGFITAALSWVYLLSPPRGTATLAGVAFGFGLLLVQALPHVIDGLMRRVELGSHE